MKCQRCPKQATVHITEVLSDERFEEVHLCDECAKKYLYEPGQALSAPAKKGNKSIPAIEVGALDETGGKQCDVCGIKFLEFRNTGRLGCPHDYDAFKDDLVPLLESIHGDTRHEGKVPRRMPRARSDQIELAGLRKRLHQAVTAEQYEEAARLRDQIRTLEEG